MPRPDEPADLTVVVPTRDRPDLLAGCLDALLAAGLARSDLLVVDSASRSPAAVDPAHQRGIAVIRAHRPGASLARNLGWRSTERPLVAFVDDDVRVSSHWASALTAPFADPSVVLVTGAVGADRVVGHRSVATTDDVPTGRFSGDWCGHVGASANIAVRREVLEAVRGFDELLGAGGRFRAAEDLDLFDRALQHGDGWHAGGATAVHEQWRSRADLLRLEVAYGVGFGARLAKLLRTQPGRARAIGRFELRRFAADVAADVRHRYEFGVLSRLAWAGGALAGLVRALLLAVQDGHLRARRRARAG